MSYIMFTPTSSPYSYNSPRVPSSPAPPYLFSLHVELLELHFFWLLCSLVSSPSFSHSHTWECCTSLISSHSNDIHIFITTEPTAALPVLSSIPHHQYKHFLCPLHWRLPIFNPPWTLCGCQRHPWTPTFQHNLSYLYHSTHNSAV